MTRCGDIAIQNFPNEVGGVNQFLK